MANHSKEYLKKIQVEFVDKLNGYMNPNAKMQAVQIKAWTIALSGQNYESIKSAWKDFMFTVKPGYLPPISDALDKIHHAQVRQREIFSDNKRKYEDKQVESRPEEFAGFIKELKTATGKIRQGKYNMGEYYNHMANVLEGIDIDDGAREHRSLAKKWIAQNPKSLEKKVVISGNISPI